MFFHRRKYAPSMRMIYAVIFLLNTSVRSQPDNTISSEPSTEQTPSTPEIDITSTNGLTVPQPTTEALGTTEGVRTTNAPATNGLATNAATTNEPATTTGFDLTGNSFSPTLLGETTGRDGTTGPITTNKTTASTRPPTTTAFRDPKACGNSKFPVFGCIDPGTNSGVVLTAFILSIVSFIGALGGLLYMLVFKKLLSPKRSRMLTNSNGRTQDKKTPIKTGTYHRQENVGDDRTKKNLSQHQTPSDPSRVHKSNVLEKQPPTNKPRVRQPKQTNNNPENNEF